MSKYHPRHMLVTGGAGFIGSHFIKFTLAHRPRVHIINLDSLTYAGSLDNLNNIPDPQRYEFINGDICDGELLKTIFEKYDIHTVVNFAAESHVDNSIKDAKPFLNTNILGTYELLERARLHWEDKYDLDPQACRFHHISTDEVFGSLEVTELPFKETTAFDPHSPYAASKAAADHLVKSYHHTYDLPITISNCSNNYGPNQHSEKFIPTIIRSCLNQKSIPVYGDGSNIRDWIHVEDHCRGILTVIKHGIPGETYNIGGHNEWSNLDVAEAICEIMDRKNPGNAPHKNLIQFVTDRAGHDWRYAVNTDKITRQTNWKPEKDFYKSLEETIDFYLNLFNTTQTENAAHVD